ncbi:carbon-nitrogen hydrolase family protein [Patescibacteria group bacterium]|nr:carbon-nitrogen hydrolase family protein [Patescibacteria group bacterium]
MSIKIAAGQIEVGDNIEKNLQKILLAITTAAAQQADYLCLPEICLVSDEKLIRNINKEIEQIKQAAKKYKINVIFGTYLKIDGHIRNQLWVINKNGETIHKYNKKHTFFTERSTVKEGKNNKVLTIDNLNFAVINCWDYAYPEDIRKLARDGAQVIFCPSYLVSHPHTKEVLDKIPQVRAFDSMSYFIMVDAFNKETFKRSKICHPLKTLSSLSDSPGIIYATIELTAITKLRQRFLNL